MLLCVSCVVQVVAYLGGLLWCPCHKQVEWVSVVVVSTVTFCCCGGRRQWGGRMGTSIDFFHYIGLLLG
jgi:hypothetical protein